LPHVIALDHPDELSAAVRRVTDGDLDLRKAGEDGARFLEAVIRTSFDMVDFHPLKPQSYTPVAVDNALTALEASINLRSHDVAAGA
jgi:hypothetical protein